MSRYLIDEIDRRPEITLLTRTEVVELSGEEDLQNITIRDRDSSAQRILPASALFVFIGASPHTEWLAGQVAMDEHRFLLTGRDLQSDTLVDWDEERPQFLETSRRGLFAVGDVHSGSVKRVASAVGEGSMAVQLAHSRLAPR
jgi:thioredoxin reductase (NADPH)